jgi:hypothetical protein
MLRCRAWAQECTEKLGVMKQSRRRSNAMLGPLALTAIRGADGLIRHVRGTSPIVEITS